MLKRLLKSQSGFSIVQGMMLAAAVAGMAYVGTKLTTDQKLAQKGAEAKGRVEQLHSTIYSILQNKDHCTATLNYIVTKTLGSTQFLRPIELNTGARPFEVNVEKLGATGNYNPAYMYMNGAVTINDMQVTFPASFSQPATLKITYGKIDSKSQESRSGKGFGSSTVAKNITIKIQTTAANAFESCYAVDTTQNDTMVKDFCDKLGASTTDHLFVWDANRQKCMLKNTKCPTGQIYTGFNSNGQPQCSGIQDWMDFSTLIDTTTASTCVATTSNNVRFVVVGNKVQVKCAAGGCTTSCNCPNSADKCLYGYCTTTNPAVGTSCSGSPQCVQVTNNAFLACSGGVWTQMGGTNPSCVWPKGSMTCP